MAASNVLRRHLSCLRLLPGLRSQQTPRVPAAAARHLSTDPGYLASEDAAAAPAPVTSLDISAGLTEEQKEMQSLALQFAMNEMFPHMAAWDQADMSAMLDDV